MFYEIKTDRLVLRPLGISDLQTVHEYAADEESTAYMLRLPNRSIRETADFLERSAAEWKKENPDFYEFAILLDGMQIGAVSIYLDEAKKSGELGWIVNKKYWRKGIASEAAFALKDFAVNTLKLSQLTAHCDDRNIPSYRLMEKLGLKLIDGNGTRVYPQSGEVAKERFYALTLAPLI